MDKTKINAKIALDLYDLLRSKTIEEILNISIAKFFNPLDKNTIHVYDFDFKNCNTYIENREMYCTKAAYFNVNGTIFKVFQII